MSATERQYRASADTSSTAARHIISVSKGPLTTSTDPGRYDAFRCRRCQKLLFKATPELFDGLTREQCIEIKCACKLLNYHMGGRTQRESLIQALRELSEAERDAVIAQARA